MESELLTVLKISGRDIVVDGVNFEQSVDSLVSTLIVVDRFVPEVVCDTITAPVLVSE
jgi:hypothetical protein